MTRRIIPMRHDTHREIQSLVPWYVTGGLGEAERAQVRAHLAQCPDCRATVSDEHRFAAALADMPPRGEAPDPDDGWAAILRDIERDADAGARSPRGGAAGLLGRLGARPPAWMGWIAAAQFCLLLGLGAVIWTDHHTGAYRALGSTPPSAAANAIVIFQPDARERDLRRTLSAIDARLVDGPTSANAYLLHMPPAGRAAGLAALRKDPQIVLAEPVDGE